MKVGESYWMLSDGEVNINLQKMNKAEVWDRALLGQGGESVDDLTKEDQKKKMMLERFQDEVCCIASLDYCRFTFSFFIL